jgi:glycogen synthase
LKIAIVGPYPPFIGGTSTFLSHLIPALENQGVCTRVFNTQKGDPERGALERVGRLWLFSKLAIKAAFSGCDIIHCHSVNWANLLGHGLVMIVGRTFRKPTVLTLHAGNILEKLRTGRSRTLARLILRFPQIVTTVTPELCVAVTELGIKNAYFIPNNLLYVNEKDFAPIPTDINQFISSHRPLIASVGAMERVHGIEVLVKALPILLSSYPDIGVIIIAYKSVNIQYQSEINKLIIDLNLNKSVVLPKQLPSVVSVVKTADLLVRATFSDGDSIAVREALALGIPVVASDVGFRPQGVARFPPGDHIQLAAKIMDVLRSPKKIQRTYLDSDLETIGEYLRVYQVALNS